MFMLDFLRYTSFFTISMENNLLKTQHKRWLPTCSNIEKCLGLTESKLVTITNTQILLLLARASPGIETHYLLIQRNS